MTSLPPLAEPTQPSASSTRRSTWLTLFSLILAAVLLYFTLRGLDWSAFRQVLKDGNYTFLLLTIPIGSINYLIRALRWRVFVSAGKKVGFSSVFWANMVGYMGNAYLPARAGELLRSAFLGEKTGLGTGFILATALAERILDAIFLVLVGSLALLLQPGISPALAGAVRIMALAGGLGLAFIVIAPFQEALILHLFQMLPLPEKISQKISEAITRFLLGMRALHSIRRLALFIGLTLLIWLVDALANMAGVQIVSQKLSLAQSLLFLAALGLSSAIPSTPGYIGVYQFVAVAVLVPFGFSRADALAYILISQILNYVLVSFWGLLGLWRINKSK